MSYDLDFWKYEASGPHDHQVVYQKLSDGETVAGLATLPIEEIRLAVADAFSSWNKLDEDHFEHTVSGARFEICTTPQFFRVDCYSLEPGDMNRFIDVLNNFDCPLYDPQAGMRYAVG